MTLVDKVTASLYGIAIGDGMGAPVEGWNPADIAQRFSSVEKFLPPTHGEDPAKGKGDGRFTDDTLLTEALIHAYMKHEDHFDAYDYERFLLPEITRTDTWVPEYQKNTAALERLFWPEKYPWMRLALGHVDPRQAGVGNLVNCGVAMWMMPVGAVNAGDPLAAYDEATLLGAAHNESFALEAAGVMAAACAAAFAPGASIATVVGAAKELARDGTRNAIEAALKAACPGDSIADFVAKVRAAVARFDPRMEHAPDEKPLTPGMPPASDVGKPSRVASIEELPVALAALQFGHGDFTKTLHAAVFYGRDCDSIAGMAAGLHGAIYGLSGVPAALRKASDAANRRDLAATAAAFTRAILAIHAKDQQRWAAHAAACTA